MHVLVIILFKLLLGDDTPRYLISHQREDEAKEVIQKIYNVDGNMTKCENILRAERNAALPSSAEGEGVVENQHVTAMQALFRDERYIRPSWVAIFIMMFQCLTGYYAIIAFSVVILRDAFDGGDGMTVRQGVFLI